MRRERVRETKKERKEKEEKQGNRKKDTEWGAGTQKIEEESV